MKKLLGILVLGLLCCNYALAKSTKIDIKSFKVTKPIGLLDFNARRAELKSDPEFANKICTTNFYTLPKQRAASSVEVVGHGTQYTIYNMPNPFDGDILWMDGQVSGWLRTGDNAYLKTLRDWMLASANAGSLTKLVPDPDKYFFEDPLFNLRFILKPTFVAYDLLRQTKFLKPEENQKILDWLAPIVKNSDRRSCESKGKCKPDSKPGEHWTLHDYTTLMLWGAVSGDNYYFQRGIKMYVKSLKSLSSKGASKEVKQNAHHGLQKQNEDVGYFVMLAEIAANQGYDLYSVEQKKKSLFTAFEYLIWGIEHPDKIYKKRTQDLLFLQKQMHSDKTPAWFEPFLRRWPDHELSKKFSTLIKTTSRPMFGGTYGGNLSCLFYRKK